MRLGDFAADHGAHQPFAGHLRCLGRNYQFAVTEHGDAVGDLQRFFERVRDIDDRHPLGAQVAHEVEEMDDLLGGEAGRWLVENDDPRLVVDRARDLDHLSLGGAEQRDRRRRVDVEVERLQELLRLDVESSEAGQQLFRAQLDVLRRRHRRDKAGLLIHHADPDGERVARSVEMGRLAIDDDLARGELDRARDRLAERRLAGPVLAYQGMDLAATEIEIDGLDGVDAAVDLVAVDYPEHRIGSAGCHDDAVAPQRFDVVHGFTPDVSCSTRPCPLEMMTRPCAASREEVMPW